MRNIVQGKVFLFGGMSAIIGIVASVLVQPPVQSFSVLRTLTPAGFLGFILGTVVMCAWVFIRTMAVRLLLGYNGWFFTPKSPINKLWYLLMLLLVGRKNWGSGNYQQVLPSLPVPSLDQTLKKYLEYVKPLLSKDEFENTEKAVKNLKKQGGRKLQYCLKLRSWTSRNWMAEWWIKYAYLRERTPLPFNSTCFALGCWHPKTSSQLDRAAMMMYCGVIGCFEFHQGKWKNLLAQNLVPLCMEYTKYAVCTCRIPGKEEDEIKQYDFKIVDHCVVFRKGQMYEVKCCTPNGTILPPALIKKQLERVVELAGDEVCDEGYVCSFTGLHRTKWAELRERLLQDPTNRKALESIQSCYTVYVLADETPDEDDFTALSQEVFHGHGYDRWFDKCISMIVFANGNIGSNIDHTALDGSICGQYWEYMSHKEHYDENGHVPELTDKERRKFTTCYEPKQLKWNLKEFKEDIQDSKTHLQAMIDDSDLILMYPSYGKRFPKKCCLSPDGWFQMALQLTYYRLHKKLVLTKEGATTRLYYKGRTESIYVVSDQSKKWVEAMDNPSCSNKDKKKLLKEAIECHLKRKYEAMKGMGIDRHLVGLYFVAKMLKMDPLPDLFQDKAFELPLYLLTSQTPNTYVEPYSKEDASVGGGFGTLTEQGYAVSYFINGEDMVLFSIHSKKSFSETSSSKFAEMLNQTLEDMKQLYRTATE